MEHTHAPLWITTLPSHASNVIILKPPEYVARYGVERLMSRCSHRRSSRVLLFDLGMQLCALLTYPTLHRIAFTFRRI
jgi:hypothetical protein